MSDRATFEHEFRFGLEEDAYRWTNPDGSTGGIVAVSATVSEGVTISETAEVFPGSRIGMFAVVGEGALIREGVFIGSHVVIGEHAYVGSRAHVGDHAHVGSHAHVGHYARIGYRARLEDRTRVGDRVRIGARAIFNRGDWIFTAGPQGSRGDHVSVIWSPGDDLRWWVGCQHGLTTAALVARIKDKHGIDPHAEDYLHLIRMVETHPGLARAKAAHAAKGGVND